MRPNPEPEDARQEEPELARPSRDVQSSATIAAALVTLIAVELGSARVYVPEASQLTFSTIAAVLLAGLLFLWQTRGALRPITPRWLILLAIVMGAASIHIRRVLYFEPLFGVGLVAILGVLVMFFSLTRPSRTGIFVALAGALITGLSLRWVELTMIPIDPTRSDMIPLVIVSLRELGRGLPPYRMYHMPWDVPLTYLPLNWLAYGPLTLAQVDPRWTSTLAELSVAGAIFFVSRRRADKTLRNAALLLWCAWFVAHSMIAFDGQVASAVQWAALAWMLAFAIELHRFTPIAVGAAIATTALTLPLLPSIALAWAFGRHHPGASASRPRRRAPFVRALLIAAGVAALIIGPFFVASPRGFLEGVVFWFNDLDRFPRAKWNENHAWAAHPGFCGLFWTLHLERLLKPIQLALVVVLAWRFRSRLRARPVREVLGRELVTVMTAFLLFNPMVWGYLWEAVVVLALVTLAAQKESGPLLSKTGPVSSATPE